MKNMRVAIIPARGGSKGVPRKNVRLVAGKPLVAWTIEAARNAQSVDKVIVSTDDAEIARVSESYGARVIQRPPEISGDTASSESAILHVLGVLEAEGALPDTVIFMQCTSPLTESEDIDNCVRKYEESEADSAFTAKEFFYFIWKQMPDGSMDGVNHDRRFRPRRQDREPQYEENGAIYVMNTQGFLKAKHRFFGKIAMSLMPESRCFEIDTEFDLEIASRLLAGIGKKKFKKPEITTAVFDFDGVMTDDCVYTSTDGKETVKCSREDGQGIAIAKRAGMRMLILSSEQNAVVAARARKLGLEVIHGTGLVRKAEVLRSWLEENAIDRETVAFMGNDLNDLECMKLVGFALAPANANAAVKEIADYITMKNGGNGAVREALDFLRGIDK